MPVETDADRLIFLNTSDFGSPITYAGATINGVFDNETVEVDGPGHVPMLQEQPQVEVRTIDIPNIAQNDRMIIDNCEYRVTHWFEDGKGMTKVMLEKQ